MTLAPDQIRYWTPNRVLAEARRLGLRPWLTVHGPNTPASAIYTFTDDNRADHDSRSGRNHWTIPTTEAAVVWLRGYAAGAGYLPAPQPRGGDDHELGPTT